MLFILVCIGFAIIATIIYYKLLYSEIGKNVNYGNRKNIKLGFEILNVVSLFTLFFTIFSFMEPTSQRYSKMTNIVTVIVTIIELIPIGLIAFIFNYDVNEIKRLLKKLKCIKNIIVRQKYKSIKYIKMIKDIKNSITKQNIKKKKVNESNVDMIGATIKRLRIKLNKVEYRKELLDYYINNKENDKRYIKKLIKKVNKKVINEFSIKSYNNIKRMAYND